MKIVLGKDLVALVAVAVLPCLLSVLFLLPFHETPKFLLLKREDREAAAKALIFYQGLGETKKLGRQRRGIARENSRC